MQQKTVHHVLLLDRVWLHAHAMPSNSTQARTHDACTRRETVVWQVTPQLRRVVSLFRERFREVFLTSSAVLVQTLICLLQRSHGLML